MLCKDLMQPFVYRMPEDATVAACAQLMRDERIGLVPITDGRDVVLGVVTDRDIVTRVVATGRAAGSTHCAEVMSRGLVYCGPMDDHAVAERRMAATRKSRLLVLDAERHCLGIISLTDIAQQEESGKTGRLLKDVTRREAMRIGRA
jgi:CBS domain-containing protein